jgi:hypothetical protein
MRSQIEGGQSKCTIKIGEDAITNVKVLRKRG